MDIWRFEIGLDVMSVQWHDMFIDGNSSNAVKVVAAVATIVGDEVQRQGKGRLEAPAGATHRACSEMDLP